MGLEAALGLVELGFDATVLEKGRVGESLRRWGPTTRFFSPLGMNLSARGKKALGPDLPDDRALLSGPEMAERVLELQRVSMGFCCARVIASSFQAAFRFSCWPRQVSARRAASPLPLETRFLTDSTRCFTEFSISPVRI